MKIQQQDKTIFIADDSPAAKKIAQGFDFDVDENNKITIKTTATGLRNRYQLARAIEKANTLQDLKVILIKMTKFLDGVV